MSLSLGHDHINPAAFVSGVYAMCKQLMKQHKWETAQELLTDILSFLTKSPKPIREPIREHVPEHVPEPEPEPGHLPMVHDVCMDLAKCFVKRQMFAEAEPLLRRVLETTSTSTSAITTSTSSESSSSSESLSTSDILSDVHQETTRLTLGHCLLQLQKLADADEVLSHPSLNLARPHARKVLWSLITELNAHGNVEDSLRHLTRFINAVKPDVPTLLAVAQMLMDAHRYSDAIPHLVDIINTLFAKIRAENKGPSQAEAMTLFKAHARLAKCLLQEGRYHEAVTKLDLALKGQIGDVANVDFDDDDWWDQYSPARCVTMMCFALHKLQHYKELEELVIRVLPRVNPSKHKGREEQLHCMLFWSLYHQERHVDAESVCRKMLARSGHDDNNIEPCVVLEWRYQLSRALIGQRRYSEAQTILTCDILHASCPPSNLDDCFSALRLLAQCAVLSGDPECIAITVAIIQEVIDGVVVVAAVTDKAEAGPRDSEARHDDDEVGLGDDEVGPNDSEARHDDDKKVIDTIGQATVGEKIARLLVKDEQARGKRLTELICMLGECLDVKGDRAGHERLLRRFMIDSQLQLNPNDSSSTDDSCKLEPPPQARMYMTWFSKGHLRTLSHRLAFTLKEQGKYGEAERVWMGLLGAFCKALERYAISPAADAHSNEDGHSNGHTNGHSIDDGQSSGDDSHRIGDDGQSSDDNDDDDDDDDTNDRFSVKALLDVRPYMAVCAAAQGKYDDAQSILCVVYAQGFRLSCASCTVCACCDVLEAILNHRHRASVLTVRRFVVLLLKDVLAKVDDDKLCSHFAKKNRIKQRAMRVLRQVREKGYRCGFCNATGEEAHEATGHWLRVCTGCNDTDCETRYCDQACQRAHWPEHRAVCHRLDRQCQNCSCRCITSSNAVSVAVTQQQS
jgi:tetratricopeptide (TPR) repeat protein